MYQQIMNYFLQEKGTTLAVAEILTKNLMKYDDICEEFLYWIEHRTYVKKDAIIFNEYSAKRISEEAPFLDGSGVYNSLVMLKENPEKALSYFRNGFPRK